MFIAKFNTKGISDCPYNETKVVTWLDYMTKSEKQLAKKIKQSKKVKEIIKCS